MVYEILSEFIEDFGFMIEQGISLEFLISSTSIARAVPQTADSKVVFIISPP